MHLLLLPAHKRIACSPAVALAVAGEPWTEVTVLELIPDSPSSLSSSMAASRVPEGGVTLRLLNEDNLEQSPPHRLDTNPRRWTLSLWTTATWGIIFSCGTSWPNQTVASVENPTIRLKRLSCYSSKRQDQRAGSGTLFLKTCPRNTIFEPLEVLNTKQIPGCRSRHPESGS